MTDQTALITGASRGLGAALAEQLSATHHVIAVGRTTGALEELDDRIQTKGGQATLAPMDITEAAAMQQLCRSIHDRWGSLDLWCHTAIHAAPLSPATHGAEKDLTRSLDINVTATSRLISYVALLLGTKGRAIFFADDRAGEKFFSAYGATKAAQIALAQSWQAETTRTGPPIDIAAPPPMPTATRARFFPGEDRSALTPCDTAAQDLLRTLSLTD